jgi:hypothetical protein
VVSEIEVGFALGNPEKNEYGILVETTLERWKIERMERYENDIKSSRFGESNWNKVAHDRTELRTF